MPECPGRDGGHDGAVSIVNRLGEATSPYLQQHRDNPVDWQEWGDEAFELGAAPGPAGAALVGYAACHWCHVMAHESFEDPDAPRS